MISLETKRQQQQQAQRDFAADVDAVTEAIQQHARLLSPSIGEEISHGEGLDLLRVLAVTTIDRLWERRVR
jgi:hypothetical protein